MISDKHVELELIAYLDGEISTEDEARIKRHLVTCESCRESLEELQIVRQDLSTTLDHALMPVRLSRQADERIRQVILARLERRPVWWQALWQHHGLISQAVMAVFIVFMSVTVLRVMAPSPPMPVHETIVLGQDRFAPGSQGALRVVVQSLGSALPSAAPISGAEVIVSLVRASGAIQRLYRGQTDTTGSAEVSFILPENSQGDAELIVETTSSAGTERIIRPIQIERSYKIYLGSDKPTYRPGQTIYLRAMVMDSVESVPAADESVTFQLLDGKKQIIFHKEVNLSGYGVGFAEYRLPESAELGFYTIRAVTGDTTVDRVVEINLYPLPAFNIALETEESFAMPGEIIHGSIVGSYFFGKPVQGQTRIIVYTGEDKIVTDITGPLDKEGLFRFTIDLPEVVDEDSLTIVASVFDKAGHFEGIERRLPLSSKSIVIHVVPESGRLKSSVENTLYLATVYPDGRPAQTDLAITFDDTTSHLRTDTFGMAVYRFTPQASTEFHVVAEDSEGRVEEAVISLSADKDVNSILLRTDQAAYIVGETITLQALTAAPDITYIYLDVVRSGQTAAVFSAPVVENAAVFAIDLDSSLTGALNLRAYALKDAGVIVEDSRLVVVDPEGRLNIAVSPDKASYRPGDTAHLGLETTVQDHEGIRNPLQTVLGVAVVDTSVLSLEMLPPGFARTYFLMDNALLDSRATLPGFDPPALLEGDEAMRQAQDVAARAAWAGVQNVTYSAPSRGSVEAADEHAVRRLQLARNLSWLLILLPLGNCVLVVEGLLPSGVFWRACRRLGWALLALAVLVPIMVADLFLGMLLPWLGTALAAGLLLLVIVLVIGLFILSWVQRDKRLQLATGLVTAYVAVTIALLFLVSLSGGPSSAWVIMIALLFILFLMSLYVLGQGLILEKRRMEGWILTLLVVLLILLSVSLPAVPQLQSNLSRTMSNPLLYSGPIGWLSGCAPSFATGEPSATEAPSKEVEVEATEAPAPTPSPLPTAMPAPPGTATPVTVPIESYPFRQLFPETLYWAPHVETNRQGAVNLDIEMADSLTTWRLTALGSTKDGDIGAAGFDLLVFQDFFVDVEIAGALQVNQRSSVTLTVYNYLDTEQTVRWELVTSEDYLVDESPDILKVEAGGAASTTFEITPARSGTIVMAVKAVGDNMVDAVSIDLDVSDK